MSGHELDAAGITDPALRASYARCRRLLAEHGRTYHLATLLLPPAKRPFVQALYGFARYADEIVDDVGTGRSEPERAAEFTTFSAEVLADLRRGDSRHPVTSALVDTVRRWDIDPGYVEAFLAAMRMDLDVREYATYADLTGYMYGSAAVIGLQMVPILGHPTVPREVVEPYAHDLGVAFQLANFIRDVGEDLRRGRIYFPLEDLATFGVDRAHLERGVVDGPVRRLLAFEIARCREIYRAAWPGLRLLDPTSRDCMKTAYLLYGGILDAVERADYQVLDRRVAVGNGRRAAVALPAFARATLARRRLARRTLAARPSAVART